MRNSLVVLILLIATSQLWGQSLKEGEIVERSFSTLSVSDELIYHTLDSVLERERWQPYFADSSLSLYMNFFFCTDSNCNPSHDLFIVDIGFFETIFAITQAHANGYFTYHGFDVFVYFFQAPPYIFQPYIPLKNCFTPDNCTAISPRRDMPQGFTMLKDNDIQPKLFQGIWDESAEKSIMGDSKYDFYHSLYLYHHDTLRLITYSLEE